MSKGARLRAERAQQRNPLNTPYTRPRPGERIEIMLSPGATIDTPEAIAAMQKQTHDGLIIGCGQRRRSGVRWHHIHGQAACEKWLDDYEATSEGELEQSRLHSAGQPYREFFRAYGDQSVLVVAFCDAVRAVRG